MIDPYTDKLLGELLADIIDDEPQARESLRCDICRALDASLPALLDHYDRRH